MMAKRKSESSSELVVTSPRDVPPAKAVKSAELAVAAPMTAPMGAGTTHSIQTTMRPDQTITVGETEYQELLLLGLVYSGSPVTPPADFYDGIITDKINDSSSHTSAALKAAFDAHGAAAGLALIFGA